MTATTRRRTYWTVAGIFLVTLAIGLLATTHGKAATKPAPPPPPEVSVMHLAGEDVATYREYPARTYARDLVEVRGRVDGYVDRRTFDIGSDVRAGQVLYVLDLRPYEAEVERLVTKTSPQPLTTIVPLDPVWVRFQVSEAELPLFQPGRRGSLAIELVLSDGSVPAVQGHIENTLNGVNTKTGTLEVQATFRNQDHSVLPGQFVRVRVRTAERRQAVLVPQRAVQELQGQQSVLTVAADNIVQTRAVVTGDRVDQRWIVEQGLKAGDVIVVDGLQKVRSGTRVTPRVSSASTRANGR